MNQRIKILIVLVLTVIVAEFIQAGWFSNSIGKSIASKTAGKAAQKTATRQVTSKSSTHMLTNAEKVAMRRIVVQLDRDALKAIERKYGQYITTQQLRLAQSVPVIFKDKAAYQRYLRKVYPEIPPAERARILGHYDLRAKRTFVDMDNPLLPRVVAHERIHQLGHPGFRGVIGGNMDEGMTEYFASKIYGDLAIKGFPKFYPREVRIIGMLNAHVGSQPLSRAYFQGDIGVLKRSLDKQLGAGSLVRISRAMDDGDFIRAEQILLRGYSSRR